MDLLAPPPSPVRLKPFEAKRYSLTIGCFALMVGFLLLMGPIAGGFVAAMLFGMLMGYGFHLARPVAKRAEVDRLWAGIVYVLCFACLSGFIAVIVFAAWPLDIPPNFLFGGTTPAEIVVLGVVIWFSGAGAFVAAIHILRRRAPRDRAVLFLKALPALPVLAIIGAFGGTVLLFVCYIAIGLYVAGFFGAAVWYTLRPAPTVAPSLSAPVPEEVAPSFHRFQGD